MHHPDKTKTIIDREKAIAYAIQQISSEDILLIAGKGHETYQHIRKKKLPFHDKTVVIKHLQHKGLHA